VLHNHGSGKHLAKRFANRLLVVTGPSSEGLSRLFALNALLLTVGVAGPGLLATAQKANDQPKAMAYIYRNKDFSTRTWRPSVYVDEDELARTQNGRYLIAKLDPGKHTFRSELGQEAVQMELKGGECYYFRVEIASGFWKAHGRLVAVTREQGTSDLRHLEPIDRSNVKDKSTVLVEEQVGAVLATCAFKPANETPQSGAAQVSTPQPAGSPGATAKAANASLVVFKSTPDGADITVDEKYMGSTPATLELASGDHKIKLEKSGFKSWERTLTVSAGGSATLDATLEKQ